MVWRLEFAPDALDDFSLIAEHLIDSYLALGDPADTAVERAIARVSDIRKAADRILKAPHRGQACDDILLGCRSLTLEGAIFYFQIDEEAKTVSILAIFFGSQNHRRHMLTRLLGPSDG